MGEGTGGSRQMYARGPEKETGVSFLMLGAHFNLEGQNEKGRRKMGVVRFEGRGLRKTGCSIRFRGAG